MTVQPRAIFFDMDGTILDWRTGMEERWAWACKTHCDGSYAPADLLVAVRRRRDWFWEDTERQQTGRLDLDEASREIVRLAFADLGLGPVELAHRIANDYRASRAESIKPYPGALETLAAVRARGIRTALLTNGGADAQRESVERHGLTAFFDCVLIEGEFGVGKPDERIFRHALRELEGDPESTWMVGDSLEADIAPALALGMHAVWVDVEGEGLPEDAPVRPQRVVRGIHELLF